MDQQLSGYGRIIAVLDEITASHQVQGVRQLSESTGVARSTVGRILQSLAAADILESATSGEYRVGPKLEILLRSLRREHPLLRTIRQHTEELAHRVSSTVVLSMYDPTRGRAFIAYTKRHSGPAEYALQTGAYVPLHAGSVGLAISMSLGSQALEKMRLEPFTESTILDREELREKLSQSRKRGYALSIGQHIELAAGAAAPFRAYGMIGSVSVSGPKFSTSEEDLHQTGKMLLQTTADIRQMEHTLAPTRHPVVTRPEGSTAAARFLRLISLAIGALPGGIQPGQQLAARIGANPATARNLLDELVEANLLVRSDRGIFPGPLLFLWSSRVSVSRQLADYADPFLRALSQQTGETVSLAQYDNQTEQATTARVLRGPQSTSYGLTAGGTVPLHAGAMGKAILANCPPNTLDKLGLNCHTENTLKSHDQLRNELEEIRSRGYSIGDGERIPDAYGIGAPIFQDDSIKGSIAVTIARSRRGTVDVAQFGTQVRTAASELSKLLSIGEISR